MGYLSYDVIRLVCDLSRHEVLHLHYYYTILHHITTLKIYNCTNIPLGLRPGPFNLKPSWMHMAQEFNAGDVGIAGGLQVLEPAVNHPTAIETIKRSWVENFSRG